ncbi:uncharacterized protein LOC122038911 [Zingiber officinale]|nr:uncharacterized protein LOC122038911 [Zingiber officinale]
MGDLDSWPPLADADASGGHDLPCSHPQPPNPHPSVIKAENWRRAEEATREVLRCIRPTVVSEERRKAVVDYVQELLTTRMGSKVFPFGSVPLKTYLPDGDIDLTALGAPNNEEMLASELCSVLGEEEHNKDSGFEVNDVQLIRAEVKLVKCIVQNIVVDISFNQIGGLCTLCFLEKINEKIGKDHLFKRSIILIKAWCYYESRILGAHHGLISTYALEILILHVFHLFHENMDGPLAVLYRFLDYYSKFDWNKYCITLQGPVSITSLPKLVLEPLETKGNGSPLTEEFIEEYIEMFSVPSRMYGNSNQVFMQKYLNIVDPLKPNNNLGRSVSKSNFHRIRSAFTFGARKLGRILQSSSANIVDEINLFFRSTLCRHGSRERPDVQDVTSSSLKSGTVDHRGDEYKVSNLNAENGNEDLHFVASPTRDSNGASMDAINNLKNLNLDANCTSTKQHGKHSASSPINADWSRNGSLVSEEDITSKHSIDDATILHSTRASRSSDESFKPSTSGKVFHAPHLFFCSENNHNDRTLGSMSTRDNVVVGVSSNKSTSSCDEMRYKAKSLNSASWPREPTTTALSSNVHESPSANWNCEDSIHGDCPDDGKLDDASPSSNNLSDLCGDYQLYYSNLHHAQEFQECLFNPYLVPLYHAPPSPYQNKHSWNVQNMYAHVGATGLVHMPPLPTSYYLIPPLISNDYGAKDITKTRGTGTYLPNTNSRSYRERHMLGRGRNQMQANHFPRYRRNGYGDSPYYEGTSDERNHVPPPPPIPPSFLGNGHGDPISTDRPQSPGSAFMVVSPANGYPYTSEGKLEFGNFGPVTTGSLSSGRGANLESANAVGRGSGSSIPTLTVESPHRSLNNEKLTQPYQLKDDGDFPPLAG